MRLGLCINVDYIYYPLPKVVVLNEMMNQVYSQCSGNG